MDKKCSKCGGELIEGAFLDDFSFHSVIYSPMDEFGICDNAMACGNTEELLIE